MIANLLGRNASAREQEFAIIGLGRFGTSLALELEKHGQRVLGIDRDQEIVQRLADEITQAVGMDATDEDALRAIDITSFDTVIVAIGTDFESNLMITVSLKQLGVQRVICKAVNDRQRTVLARVGADLVLLPEVEAGERLARDLISPGIRSQLRLGRGFSIIEVPLPAELVGQSLAQADLRRQYSVNVLVIERGEQMVVNPDADSMLTTGDVLVMLGPDEQLQRFTALS